MQAFEQAITHAADPDTAATAWHHLGTLLALLGHRRQALAAYQRSLESNPLYDPTYVSLAIETAASGQEELAARFLAQALLLNPSSRDAHREISILHRRRGRLAEAVASARLAVKGPAVPLVYISTLATALSLHGDPEGLLHLQSLVDQEPNEPAWRWKLSEALLLHGDYPSGWREYRQWIALGGGQVDTPRYFTQPLWKGEPLQGKTILLYAEQGHGDTLQFARYIPLVAALAAAPAELQGIEPGGRVILEVQPSLHRLLSGLPGVDTCIARAAPPADTTRAESSLPPFDTCIPLTSLPSIFNTTLDTIPPSIAPILPPNPVRDHLNTHLRVGLAWAGNPDHWNNRLRSLPLTAFLPLANIPGIDFVSLQVGAAAEDATGAKDPASSGILSFVADCSGVKDYYDTALLLSTLDLVITVDTSIAHLAGSLGIPVWIVLPTVLDWRWGLVGAHSPWYPSATLFRQTNPGDWREVFTSIKSALELRVLDRHPASSHTMPSRLRPIERMTGHADER